MAYVNKNSLIAKPVQSSFGIDEALGDLWDTIKGGAGSVVDFFGNGLKAQGAAAALQQQAAAQAAAQAQANAGKSGPSTTTLLVGGAVVAGVLVFALRRK